MKQIKQNIADKTVFVDRKKEAGYWEKNFDLAWKKGKASKMSFSRNLSETINIRLDPATIKSIRHQAKNKGLGPTQLIRMWIMERISGKNSRLAGI